MSEKPKKFDWLFEGPLPTSIVNEPLDDFVVDFVVEEAKTETAREMAWHRWFKSRQKHER